MGCDKMSKELLFSKQLLINVFSGCLLLACSCQLFAAEDAVGQWDIKMTFGEREFTSKLTITKNADGTLAGKWTSRRGESSLSNIKFTDGKLSFTRKSTYGDRVRESTYEGTISGDTLTGMIKSRRGEIAANGKRVGGSAENADTATPAGVDAVKTLDEIIAGVQKDKKIAPDAVDQAVSVIAAAAEKLEPEELLAKLDKLQQYRADSAIPMPGKRLAKGKKLDWQILTSQIRALKKVSPEKVTAHPCAEGFPGVVPAGADRVTEKVEIVTDKEGWDNRGIYGNPGSPYWHSTGLYAAPGEVVTVTVPDSVAGKGVYVRIGCHSDRLWRKNSWLRPPDICIRRTVEQAETKIANAFGGLVYIETNADLTIPAFSAEISGAVRAPLYVHGKTDIAKWKETIRKYPAPWAELAGEKLIITIPSKDVRNFDDPKALMDFWDGIMDHYARFLGKGLKRRRTERFVSDVQISAGYMHSGYPLMVGLDITSTIIDVERVTANGHSGVWGLFHEIGHNHQNRDWTFRGTTEVTVNLFSLYIMDKVCGLGLGGHGAITAEARAKNIKNYFAGEGEPDFGKWKSSPFLGLIMYIEMIEEFGWEPFQKVFAEYRTISEDARPKTDDDKRDQWMVRFSKTVGRDLGPFFQAWAIPTSEKARASIADLSPWMPEELLVNAKKTAAQGLN